MAGNVTLGGFLNGTPAGQVNVGPYTITASASNNLEVLTLTLASGFNSITVPVWSPVVQGVIIAPAVTNATSLTLKGVTGDTGIPLSLTLPNMFTFPASPPATIGLTAGALFTTITTVIFF